MFFSGTPPCLVCQYQRGTFYVPFVIRLIVSDIYLYSFYSYSSLYSSIVVNRLVN
nr:MAG TPA: Disulfide bond formation protein DsbB [Caudoviricetes sp.]